MPNQKNGETSVFRISGIANDEIWDIGERDAPKPILGRADIITLYVLKTNLQVFPSEPPARHANIVGWPAEKSKQKLIAIELASKSTFHKK